MAPNFFVSANNLTDFFASHSGSTVHCGEEASGEDPNAHTHCGEEPAGKKTPKEKSNNSGDKKEKHKNGVQGAQAGPPRHRPLSSPVFSQSRLSSFTLGAMSRLSQITAASFTLGAVSLRFAF